MRRWESNYGVHLTGAGGQHAPVQLAGAARGRRLQAEHRRAGRGDLVHAALAARWPGSGRAPLPPGSRCQRHLDGLAPVGRRRGAPGQCRQATGVQHQPAQLRQALMLVGAVPSTETTEAFEQGTGLIRVQAAWDLLATNAKTVDIRSSVPVNTVLSAVPGDSGRRGRASMTARASTISTPYTADLHVHAERPVVAVPRPTTCRWLGNDGTLSLGRLRRSRCRRTARVTLAGRGQRRTAYGHHSAILRPRRPVQPGHRVPDDEHRRRGARLHLTADFRLHHHAAPSTGTRR